MRRIQLDDADAAVHFYMLWQDRLHTAEFAAHHQDFQLGHEFKQEARIAKVTADDILLKRFKVHEYAFLSVEKRAKAAAMARHNLRTFILNEAWRHLHTYHPEERALEIFMGPEDYALRRKQQGWS